MEIMIVDVLLIFVFSAAIPITVRQLEAIVRIRSIISVYQYFIL